MLQLAPLLDALTSLAAAGTIAFVVTWVIAWSVHASDPALPATGAPRVVLQPLNHRPAATSPSEELMSSPTVKVNPFFLIKVSDCKKRSLAEERRRRNLHAFSRLTCRGRLASAKTSRFWSACSSSVLCT